MVNKNMVKAILWLHLLRLSRYKYSFVNYILVDILWYMIFLLGALMFVPTQGFVDTAIITFWGIVLWVILNNSVWLIAGWTWFILSIGMVDEHILTNTNPLLFITGRFITGMTISFSTIPLVLIIFTNIAGSKALTILHPLWLITGMMLMISYAVLYALALAALSLRTEVPGSMLDILNIFMYIGGGLGAPLKFMPEALRSFAILMPYTHAAEIVRYGVLGIEPYLGLSREAVIATVYLAGMAITVYFIVKRVTEYIRRYGARAVGMM